MKSHFVHEQCDIYLKNNHFKFKQLLLFQWLTDTQVFYYCYDETRCDQIDTQSMTVTTSKYIRFV